MWIPAVVIILVLGMLLYSLFDLAKELSKPKKRKK